MSEKIESVIQRRVFVSGRVQGVYFRQSTATESRKFPGLKGYVRNLPDGRVEAVFIGIEADVHAMIAYCHKGPPAALVTGVEIIEEKTDRTLLASDNGQGFSIKY